MEEKRVDSKVAGAGTITGGVYGTVSIAGAGTVRGDVFCTLPLLPP